jgi:hypothetical protein
MCSGLPGPSLSPMRMLLIELTIVQERLCICNFVARDNSRTCARAY